MPKPLHGWRAFAGEVGIIVVGVLIALAAEQVVEDLHWRNEVAGFRRAVDHELGRNLDVWAMMLAQQDCVTRRLDDLDRLLAASTAGRQLKLLGPIGMPPSYSGYYSVWNDKSADVTAHMPQDARLRYATLYDELQNLEDGRMTERDIWRTLSRFNQPEPLDHQDRMQLRELLTRARLTSRFQALNTDYVDRLAASMGIHRVRDPDQPALPRGDICKPLLAAEAPSPGAGSAAAQ